MMVKASKWQKKVIGSCHKTRLANFLVSPLSSQNSDASVSSPLRWSGLAASAFDYAPRTANQCLCSLALCTKISSKLTFRLAPVHHRILMKPAQYVHIAPWRLMTVLRLSVTFGIPLRNGPPTRPPSFRVCAPTVSYTRGRRRASRGYVVCNATSESTHSES